MDWDESQHQPALRASPRERETEDSGLASTLLSLCPPATATVAVWEGQPKKLHRRGVTQQDAKNKTHDSTLLGSPRKELGPEPPNTCCVSGPSAELCKVEGSTTALVPTSIPLLAIREAFWLICILADSSLLPVAHLPCCWIQSRVLLLQIAVGLTYPNSQVPFTKEILKHEGQKTKPPQVVMSLHFL